MGLDGMGWDMVWEMRWDWMGWDYMGSDGMGLARSALPSAWPRVRLGHSALLPPSHFAALGAITPRWDGMG